MNGEELGNLMAEGWYKGIWTAIETLWPYFLVAFVFVILVKIIDKKVMAAIKKKKRDKKK